MNNFIRKPIIDISDELKIKYQHYSSYMILFNPAPEKVVALNEVAPETFIFIFLTGSVDEQRDWSVLPKDNFIMVPMYIGNFAPDDIQNIAHQLIANAFKIRGSANQKSPSIQDIEQFIDLDGAEYMSWDKGDCSLVGLIKVLLLQEIDREHKRDPYHNLHQELVAAIKADT